MNLALRIRKLHPEQDADISLPRYMTPHASGMDICAAIKEPIVLSPGDIVLVATGFSMAIPPGFEAQIRPRSGLAVKHGIGIVNAPGTIDADYRGEVRVALINFGSKPYTIKRGDRIAQMIIQKVYRVEPEEVDTLEETARNTGGFGHTGT